MSAMQLHWPLALLTNRVEPLTEADWAIVALGVVGKAGGVVLVFGFSSSSKNGCFRIPTKPKALFAVGFIGVFQGWGLHSRPQFTMIFVKNRAVVFGNSHLMALYYESLEEMWFLGLVCLLSW